ncbi:MAG: ABC transporter permease [Bacillota bacterium]|nr:ABC transporter permease [Bacillota bacterium]
MKFIDLALLVCESLTVQRLRAVLTILGITIGIAAVIAVVAIGQGGKTAILSEIEKLGSSCYFEISVDYARGEAPTSDTFNLQDALLIQALSPAVEKIAPVSSGAMIDIRKPHAGGKPILSQLIGTTHDFSAAQNLTLQAGRFLSPADISAHARVVVLDAALADEIFPRSDPLGKVVFIKDIPALVVGIVKMPESSLLGMMKLRYAYVPLTFAHDILNSRVIHQLSGVAVSKEAVPQAIEDSLTILKKRHPRTDINYRGTSMEESLAMVEKVTSVMTLIIGAVAAIALVVGGVGVMNIMLVAVTERTREIGILMALGARRRDILQQFLFEAVILCLIGGACGILLGAGGALVIAYFAHWPPLISFWTVLMAFAFSALIGLFFGLYPASRAASLSPAEALRHL